LYLGDGMASTGLLSPHSDVGYSTFIAEEYPMTFHILLLTKKRDGFVWIAEHSAFLGQGHGNFTSVEKITHLKEHSLAFSAWGDGAGIEALTLFANQITSNSLSVDGSDPANDIRNLRDFANGALPIDQRYQMERPDTRGLIVAVIGKRPRVYRLGIVRQPVCFEVYDRTYATAGDVSNPATLFVHHYYPLCNESVSQLLAIGLHTMRLARILNSSGVGEPDAWVCSDGEFRQLAESELAEYVKFSESLDGSILNQFRKAPNMIG